MMDHRFSMLRIPEPAGKGSRMSETKSFMGLRSLWTILWRCGLFLMGWGLLAAVFFVPMGSSLIAWEKTDPLKVRFYADGAGLLTVLAATWLMTTFIDRRPFHTIGFASARMGRNLASGMGMGVLWLAASIGTAWAMGWASAVAPASISWPILLGSAIALAFNILTQQLLLCGYIFQTIRAKTDWGVAILVSAVLFSGYHAGAFHGAVLPAVNVFAAGLLFCMACRLAGNLWFPSAIHFAWNFLLGPVLGLDVSGSGRLGSGWKVFTLQGPDLFAGGAFGLEGGLIVTLTTGACIVVFLLALLKRGKQADTPASDFAS
jgi:uncharacterized protein